MAVNGGQPVKQKSPANARLSAQPSHPTGSFMIPLL
jgi:hypothetical protein